MSRTGPSMLRRTAALCAAEIKDRDGPCFGVVGVDHIDSRVVGGVDLEEALVAPARGVAVPDVDGQQRALEVVRVEDRLANLGRGLGARRSQLIGDLGHGRGIDDEDRAGGDGGIERSSGVGRDDGSDGQDRCAGDHDL